MAGPDLVCKATVVVMCCLQDVVCCRCGCQAVVWCRTVKCGSVVDQMVGTFAMFIDGRVRAIASDADVTYQATCSGIA